MSLHLPGPMSFDEFEIFRKDPSKWTPIAKDIARKHKLHVQDPQVFLNGSNLVMALDQRYILKIYPPMLKHQFVAERTSLLTLEGELELEIPDVIAAGEREGWSYLIMTRLSGQVGEKVWPTLRDDQKERILGQIGDLIGDVQSIPGGKLLDLEPQWRSFIPKQIEGCRERLLKQGLEDKYLAGLDDFLKDALTWIPLDEPPVILTGEYIPENFLLIEEGGSWNLSGLIDFGDVMTGWGEYDLLGPSTFMCEGKPRLVRSLLRGYGFADHEINSDLKRRLMTLYLLHRYCSPKNQIRIEAWPQRAHSLKELESLIWNFQTQSLP